VSRVEPRARVVVVAGTGTGIGKTHVSEGLLRAIAERGRRTAGLKPIETGVPGEGATDAERLRAASTFHVKPSPEPSPLDAPYAFPAPISPHLAARDAGAPPIRLDAIRDYVARTKPEADVVLVELAGGLFTPVSATAFNADVATELAPDVTLLVAPDRLGVLHDVFSALRAASTVPLRIDAVVLSAPETPDASTGRNASEIGNLAAAWAGAGVSPRPMPVFEFPRAVPAILASDPAMRALLHALAGRLGL
jgi:dethiobiotin synthetase